MTALLDIQPLPFPGSPFSGESGNGFFLRMAERNGLELHEFFTLLHRYSRCQLQAKDAPILARLFDCRVTELESLFVTSAYDKQCVQRFDFHGHLVTRLYLFDLQHPKVCPHCLADFGYARAEWDLGLFLWCPIHQSALIDRCPSCGCRLDWFRPGVSTCVCRHGLDKVMSGVDMPWGVKVMAVLLSRFNDGPKLSQLRFPPEFGAVLSVLASLSIDGAMRLIWILGVESGRKGDLANARRRREISAAASIIDTGFTHLRTLILQASVRPGNDPSISPSKLLINALRRMCDDGATAGDRRLAQTCIEVILPSRSKRKRRSSDAGNNQLPLLFEDQQ